MPDCKTNSLYNNYKRNETRKESFNKNDEDYPLKN